MSGDEAYGLVTGEAVWERLGRSVYALRWILVPLYRMRRSLARYAERETIRNMADRGWTVVGTPAVTVEADHARRRVVLRSSAIVTGSPDTDAIGGRP